MNPWDIFEVLGTWFGTIGSFVAVFVALYVNHDAQLPQVVEYLEHDIDHACVNLVVSNFGKGVARDVKVLGFDQDMIMRDLKAKVQKSFIYKDIPVLVPGASRKTTVMARQDMRRCESMSSVVDVTYTAKRFPFGMKVYSDQFTLDYSSFVGSVYIQSDAHEMKRSLEKLVDTHKEIEQDTANIVAWLRGAN